MNKFSFGFSELKIFRVIEFQLFEDELLSCFYCGLHCKFTLLLVHGPVPMSGWIWGFDM